ncbi:hypothetical protein LTR37_005365 [Vermiconidia calcicola]|uniref:Uncharacterized protein n=1 Tax=Vermiconidia calcicola TaxID=1690605 RepID=A0ACC3NJ04_9PEZI|nr:hypothetical protein LTR37_005365 [Vermiconidia calcicola]
MEVCQSRGRMRRKLQDIEDETGSRLSLRTTLNSPGLLSCVNDQRSSPFFQLPPELRLRVYELVFAEFDDAVHPYSTSAPYFRPGYEAPHKTDTKLLLACRRIWLEANHLPMKLATNSFWFFNGPRDLARLRQSSATLFEKKNTDTGMRRTCNVYLSETERYMDFFQRLTPLNRTQLEHVHIFAPRSWLHPFQAGLYPETYLGTEWFATKELTITIRDCDWDRWKRGMDASQIETSWLKTSLDTVNLDELRILRLELEMRIECVKQLDAITSVMADMQGDYLQRSGDVESGEWSRSTADTKVCETTGGLKQTHVQTTYLTRKILWSPKHLQDGPRKHPSGYWTVNRELVGCWTPGQMAMGKARKRDGRRSLPVWRRNHWQLRFLNERAQQRFEQRAKAAAYMKSWHKEGSLLRLV